MSELKRTQLSVKQERAVLVGVILPDSTADPRDPLGELASLAKTAGARVAGQILQRGCSTLYSLVRFPEV